MPIEKLLRAHTQVPEILAPQLPLFADPQPPRPAPAERCARYPYRTAAAAWDRWHLQPPPARGQPEVYACSACEAYHRVVVDRHWHVLPAEDQALQREESVDA